MELYKLFDNLILETANRSQIIDSIDKKVRVNIYYTGDKDAAPGKRTIEVYVLGTHKSSGNMVIRAYQIFGDTEKGEVPGWKLFRLDRITRWEPLDFKFYTPISDRDPTIKPFNKAGDGSMSTVYNIVQF